MSLFIQSANALVSRIAQWVGAIPSPLTITATSYDSATGIITVSANPTTLVFEGDFISNGIKNYTAILSTTSTTITVSDPEAVWSAVTYPGAVILKLPTQSSLEIQACIQLAELKMRVIELPGLRTNPYDAADPTILTTDTNGMAPIPADMNWPILFFQETQPSNEENPSSYGPWIIYDRVGDREIIRRRMIDQLYVRPFGVPRVIRASVKLAQTMCLRQTLVLPLLSKRITSEHSRFCLAQLKMNLTRLFKTMRPWHLFQKVTCTAHCGRTTTKTKTTKKL
jgi:hypothetical protein